MKSLAVSAVILALVAVTGSQTWRVVQRSETRTPAKGPPRVFQPGMTVCRPGVVIATYDPARRVFTGNGCPPLVVFSGGFE